MLEVTGSWVGRNRNTAREILILWTQNDQSSNCFFILFSVQEVEVQETPYCFDILLFF